MSVGFCMFRYPLSLSIFAFLCLLMSEAYGDSLFLDVESLTQQEEADLPRRTVRIDRDLLDRTRVEITHRRTSEALQLNLPDDLSYESTFTRTGDTSTGYWISGYLDSVPLSAVTLVVNENAIAGTIRTPTKAYLIRSVGKSIYVIEEVDQPAINENERVYMPELPVQPSRPPLLPLDETEPESRSSESRWMYFASVLKLSSRFGCATFTIMAES